MIKQGDKVTLHFALKLDDGELVDGNFGKPPATLVVGDGTLFNGFEACLMGMNVGDTGSFTLPPEKAFGTHNEQNLQQFNRGQFAGMVLEEGSVVSFADAAKAELPGVIVEIDGDDVTVDFNHPLAGKTLQFDVEIVEIESQ